jgi:predicted small lipoprotein YifL
MHSLLNLIWLGLLLISLNLTMGCGKKGDLIRPIPPEKQQTQPDTTEEEKLEKKLEDK